MRSKIRVYDARKLALGFVISIGVCSFFADFTYEGSRSVIGPYLATLEASGAVVSIVTGLGELLGYVLRLFSGRMADATRQYWTIAIIGYVIQMTSVPALALTHSWPVAAILIVLERVGKAIRNPSRDAMLSHAGKQLGGYGWAFGLHEALDQSGAMVGPLVVAAVLAWQGSFRLAFAILVLPAAINICLILLARVRYPAPRDIEVESHRSSDDRLPFVFWVYLSGAALVAAGFADYPLIAFHFSRTGSVPGEAIPIFYSVAMATSGMGSLVLGRLFDRFGSIVLATLTAVSALFAPLVFLGGFWVALAGAAIWGVGMGVHESIIPAVVAPMVSPHRRASAFGTFTAGYGLSWFAGSIAIGILYDLWLPAAIAFCMLTQIAAVPIFVWVGHRVRRRLQ
jgi:MFS family permease